MSRIDNVVGSNHLSYQNAKQQTTNKPHLLLKLSGHIWFISSQFLYTVFINSNALATEYILSIPALLRSQSDRDHPLLLPFCYIPIPHFKLLLVRGLLL